ncbi:MAG: hypothetical protein RIB43_16740 [Rhodospirillaceae bacterium]
MTKKVLIGLAGLLFGVMCGTIHGAALYFVDMKMIPIMPVIKGDISLVSYTRTVINLSPNLIVLYVIARASLLTRSKLEPPRPEPTLSEMCVGLSVPIGWVIGLAPFFYIFRKLP